MEDATRSGRSTPGDGGDRSRQVVLHLGAGKTGTSSLQYLLAANRDVLAAHDTLYPRTPGGARHTRLGMFAKSDADLVATGAWRRMGRPDPRRFRRRFRRRLLAEIDAASLPRVLFSDEALFSLPEEAIRRLRRLVAAIGDDVRAVVYLRRQDERLVSRYQQEVKTGSIATMAGWASGFGADLHDYHQRLVTWRSALGPDALVVRRFERSAFVNGSLYDDFLDATGIDLSADRLTPVETRNESLDAETVEFLRILNLHHVENEQAEPGYIDNTAVVEQLRQHQAGPMLTLPDDALDREMERWERSNRATARDFFHDDEGVLFREPRRSGHTTTEQRLDPTRLDQLADLVGLTPDVRGPLRAIAEREAAGGRTHA